MRSPNAVAAAFAVRTDPFSMRRSARGSITGTLFVEVDGNTFPATRWSDFPVVVLAWWIDAVCSLAASGTPAKCTFMDGPVEFILERRDSDHWSFRGFDHAARERECPAAIVNRTEVFDALRVAADTVILACRSRGWSGRDLEDLEAARRGL